MSNDAPTQPAISTVSHVYESGELVIMDGPIPDGFAPSPSGDYAWEQERSAFRVCPNQQEHSDLKGPCLLCNDEGIISRERWRYIYQLLYHYLRRGNYLP